MKDKHQWLGTWASIYGEKTFVTSVRANQVHVLILSKKGDFIEGQKFASESYAVIGTKIPKEEYPILNKELIRRIFNTKDFSEIN